MQARSLGREDPLVEEMTMPSSILVPWTEEPGELRSLGVTKSWTRLATEHTHWKGNQAQSLEWGDFRPEAWVEGKVRVLSPLKCKQGGAANCRKLAVRRRWWARVEWARRAESGDDGRHARSGPGRQSQETMAGTRGVGQAGGVRRRWRAREEWARPAESGDDGGRTRSGPGWQR